MASPLAWTLGSVLLVSLISLVGAIGLANSRLFNHRTMMFLVALAAGTLIGDAFLHLLPEITHGREFTPRIGWGVIGGFVAMFLLEAGLRLQHSHVEAVDTQHHGHEHEHAAAIAPFGWLNLIGDGVHNLLDGIVIAAAYLIDIHVGIATTIAVAAHEIPQELGDFAVLVRSGMAPAKALMLNMASALLAVIGAGAVLALGLSAEAIQAFAIPLVIGAFIYIAAADLVPELHHHSKGREAIIIMVGFLAGLLLMGLLLDLEGILPTGHDHQ